MSVTETSGMQAVMDLRDARQAAAARHPLFAWMKSDHLPVERRLDLAPAAAAFVMQFRDMNLWVLRFPEPRDEFEWVITSGTLEDMTHSRMFITDWRTLGLDERLGWRASDVLWFLYLSDEQEVFRRCGMRFIALAVADGDDALVRFGHSEAGEATGHVFLSHSAEIATELAAQTGNDYPYFGPHHLALESGHVGNTEGVFETRELSPAQRAKALELCAASFDVFDDIFTGFHDYARRYVDTGRVPERPRPVPVEPGTFPEPIAAPASVPDARHERLWRRLEERVARAAAHPFYAWLAAPEGPAPAERLCRFIPAWTMDILGYRDLAKYAFTYAEPRTDAERAINRWAGELTTHSARFINDWDGLELDDRLGLSASDTLELLYLDPDLDLHRGHLIEFAKLAMRHDDPALRWWLMTALEKTGEAFFAHTRPLAEAVEREHGVRLDYLAERHAGDAEAHQARPVTPPTPVQPGDETTAAELIDVVYDSLESQLARSYAIARADKFGISM